MNLKDNKAAVFLIFLFGCSLLLRFAYLFFLQNNYLFFNYTAGDVSYYLDWSRDIASGNWIGSEVFWGMPLYAYILAVLQNLTLGHLGGIHGIQILFAALQPVLVFLIADRLFDRKTAVLASVLTAGNFLLIDFDCLLMPTSLITTLSLSIVWLLLYIGKGSRRQDWLFLGILIGLTSLADGKFLIFFVLCLGILWKERREKALCRSRMGAFIAGAMLVIGLVTLRNACLGGSGVLISAQSGLSFYTGNHSGADGIFDNTQSLRPTHQGQDEDQKWVAEQSLGRPLTPKEISSFWMQQGLSFIRQHPGEYIKLLGKKLAVFWIDHEGSHDIDLILKRNWQERLDWNPYSLIVPFAAIGIWISRRRNGTDYLNALLLSQIGFTLIFFLTTKHRTTILPVLLIFESAGLIYFVDELRQKQFKTVGILFIWIMSCFLAFAPVKLSEPMLAGIQHSWLGFLFEQQGKDAEAAQEYAQALRLNPQDANLYFNLGNTQLKLGEETKADYFYSECLHINPNQVDCLFNLGALQQKQRNYPQATRNFEKALGLSPESPDIYFRLTQIAVEKKDCSQARKLADQIIRILGKLPVELSEWLQKCQP